MSRYDAFTKSLEDYKGDSNCPVFKSLELLQGKWTLKVIFFLLKNECMRFGELKKAIPQITNTMLTATLRELEQSNIVKRVQYNEIPPHVEYSLTEQGKALLSVFYELGCWGKDYL
ncbi:helix-turn-helix transcriptional regulator [Sporolactobacillus shoreicorticis]|uniref:Winged helix-turn-helix transcriptional regulator n=1 Tax=Sporolactobacillus shoreicorticis TaxID=1923877 RepID=A0ABW5S0U0_9BACL|nr:helix-turn-helix domain-containing protein [Sporolactobacillus shoreicorticis]MCO7125235.1 helix-turn-helix transcriptional regulator [Sporolactobacillus shoreicorticis]